MFSPFSPVDIRILNRKTALPVLETFLEGKDGLCVLATEKMLSRLNLGTFVKGLLNRHNGVWLKNIPANPTVKDVCHALSALAGRQLCTILAIGGGSAIDLGKAIAALHEQIQENSLTEDVIRQAIIEKKYATSVHCPAVIAVPTTAGTGSEVTRWATVWDPDRQRKLSVDNTGLFPKAAVIVPEFTMTMGPELTLSTGLDALSHAMEAYWANGRTPLSQALALSAVEKIKCFLPAAVLPENKENEAIRKEMCIGAVLAGLAFSITRTTACHAISYPLTMLHGLAHGFATAMTLPAVMKRNATVLPEMQNLSALFDADGGIDTWLYQAASAVTPLRLSSFGVKEEDISAIADLSFTAGRMDNNPIVFDRQQVLDILEECL